MFFYFELNFFSPKRKYLIMKKPCQSSSVTYLTKSCKTANNPYPMNTRILSLGFSLALAGALRLAAQSSAGFVAEVDGPWMRDFLLRHPEYKEVVMDGDFNSRVLINDPSLYFYIRETALEKAGFSRGLSPDEMRAAREKARTLHRTLGAADSPEALRRREEEARRQAVLNDYERAEAERSLPTEDLAARITELKDKLRNAATAEERSLLEARLARLVQLYNQRVNPSNAQ